jgi:RNAse (barnase) inhibitor barstar
MTVSAYQSLLRRSDLAGVYHLPLGDREKAIAAGESNGYCVFSADLRRVRDKEELLDTLAKALAFPEWFGHNYDALYDCLCDMGWRPAEGYLILLGHCDGIHGRAEQDFITVLDIFNRAAAEWRQQGINFWCLVDMQADGIAWLPIVTDGQ